MEILQKIDSSIAAVKERREEKLRKEKEALSLLGALVERAREGGVCITLSPPGEEGSQNPLVIKQGKIETGGDPPFIRIEDLVKRGGTLKEKIFSTLYLALEGQVGVKVE